MKTIVKKIAVFTAIVIISTGSIFAQKSGVFKSYADYLAGKMDYGVNCATESHKIKLNNFFGKDYITVVHNGKPYDLKKAEIWGFQLCDEKIVRFQGKADYTLGDKGGVWIYTKQTMKTASARGGMKNITAYYFSKEGNDKIKELTLLNLKAAFPDNHMLHDAIDGQFKSDASLSEYDQFHKHYKINHFLESKGIK